MNTKENGKKLTRIYYSPKGFWKVLPAVKKLAQEARDPSWSCILGSNLNREEPVLYHLKDGPKRDFVREELLIALPGT